MQIIDLSQDIYEGMKVYPGHLKTVQFEHATHEETAPRFDGGFSFQTTGFMLNDNGPTHVDSFSHLDPDPSAETIEKTALRFVGCGIGAAAGIAAIIFLMPNVTSIGVLMVIIFLAALLSGWIAAGGPLAMMRPRCV